MTALERALLALDLGERFRAFAKSPAQEAIFDVCRRHRLGKRFESLLSKK